VSRNFKPVTSLSGQSLIEVVVGISVVVILAISLITTVLLTQRTARSAQNNTTATKLAQQTIEQLRIFRDRNPVGFASQTCSGLILNIPDPNIPAGWSWSVCPSSPDYKPVLLNNVTFKIRIATCYADAINTCLTTGSSNKRLATVTVSWEESSGNQTVTNKTLFTDWCAGGITPGSPCPSP